MGIEKDVENLAGKIKAHSSVFIHLLIFGKGL